MWIPPPLYLGMRYLLGKTCLSSKGLYRVVSEVGCYKDVNPEPIYQWWRNEAYWIARVSKSGIDAIISVPLVALGGEFVKPPARGNTPALAATRLYTPYAAFEYEHKRIFGTDMTATYVYHALNLHASCIYGRGSSSHSSDY